MKCSFTAALFHILFLLPTFCFGQGDILAVDDSVCIMIGQNFMFNVKANDSIPQGQNLPVVLTSPSSCFELTPEGQLLFIGDESCCGEHKLRYQYLNCSAPNCMADIEIIVKCPKPDCFFVDLDDYDGPVDPVGGNDPGCAYACENSQSTYFFNYNPLNNYTWVVLGGTFVAGANPAEILVTWGAMGTGSVTLTITPPSGPPTLITVCVNILEGPVANFQPSDFNVCLGSPISFTNTSTGGTSFFWDYGDGSTSTMFAGSHSYSSPGTYTVCLTVMRANFDDQGHPLCCCSDSICMDVVVDSLPGPDIFCISTLCAGDSSCYWTDAANCGNYYWTVLDENNLPIVFMGQGTDTICVQWGSGPIGTVSLYVSGCDSLFCDDTVSVIVPIIPSTTLINGATNVCQNSTNTYTVDKWISAYYDWMVTGGVVLSGQGTNTVTILWGPGPTGTITLNYSSDFLGGLPGHERDSCMGTATLTVNIKPRFDVTGPMPSVVCLNSTSTFFATSVPSNTYTWTIVPAAPFVGQGTDVITVTWSTGPGNYVVTAMPTNPNVYCNMEVTKVIYVVEVPKPDAIVGPVSICPGDTYSYLAQGSVPGAAFDWTVVGGTPSSFIGNPITVTWNAVGPYVLAVKHTSLSPPFCMSDTIQLAMIPKLINGPLTITGLPACINTTQTYTAGPAQHPDATYTWTVTLPNMGSVVGGQGTPTATVQWNNVSGFATLTLVVGLCNATLTKSISVQVFAPVQPNITQIGVLCPGVPAVLDAGPGFLAYAWSTLATTQTITITTGGNYIVTTTDNNGCTAIDTYLATALPGPTAVITPPGTTLLCIIPPNPPSATIYAVNGPGYSFNWFCNGVSQGLPAGQDTLVHINTNVPGTFAYCVVVTDLNGCMNKSNTVVIVQDTCFADPPCNPEPYNLSIAAANQFPNCSIIDFTVTSSANVTLTGWNFGDPNSNVNLGTLPNAIHDYTVSGCFKVFLSGTVPELPPGNGVCVVTAGINVCVPLAANFSFTAICSTATFTDLSNFLPADGPPTSWSWDFGDLGMSNVQNPVHTYPGPGTYTVMLTVMNANGCKAKVTRNITVGGAPVPVITANPNPACVGEPVMFSATAAGIIGWAWDFDDGSTNGAQNPSHTYLTAGTYNVTLTVTDAFGCTNTATLALVVNPAVPPGVITVAPGLTVCDGTVVTLTAPAGYTYVWSTFATTQAIMTTLAGTYTVAITDANGCTRVLDPVAIVVLPAPPAYILGNPVICDVGCTTLSAPLGSGYTYQWLDASGNPILGATGQTLVVCDNNLLAGYSVIVTDANLCSDTSALFVVTVAVSPVFTITISPDDCEGTPVTLTITPIQANVVYTWSNGATGTSITVLQAGTYYCIGTDTTSGCQGIASAIIHPLPDLCLVPVGCYECCDPDTICGPPGMAAYQWNKDGLPITGETQQCLIVTQTGTYTLTCTTPFGCTDTSDSLMLTVINCACDGLMVEAEPLEGDSCCWIISYTNPFDNLLGLVIHSDDTDFNFDLSSLDPSLIVYSLTANSIGLVNSVFNTPLPEGALDSFLIFCLTNVQNMPQQVIFDWYDFEFDIVCSDTLEFDCPVEPDCLYLAEDSIYCHEMDVYYDITICNPIDAGFSITYVAINVTSPAGIIVTPPFIDASGDPIDPGECQTYTLVLSGPNIADSLFCFNLTAHDVEPGPIDTSLCCSLDTLYCIEIPDCEPCDDVGVEIVEDVTPADEEGCCYDISLYNNYADDYFDGITLCMLSPGVTMTINNPFGSGWFTTSFTPTVIALDVVPPLGNNIPLGVVTLPTICIQTDQAPPQFLEIKWMKDGEVVCRDTIELECEPPCGYISDEVITCNPDGTGGWVYSGTIHNTSPYTMGEGHIVFTSPAGLGIYNQTIVFGGGLLSGGTWPFTLNLGAPAMSGDTVCFTVALHSLDDDDNHTQCCNFYDCIVLPDCAVGISCLCDDSMMDIQALGIFYQDIQPASYIVSFQPLGTICSNDVVYWYFTDTPVVEETTGNDAVTHTFPGPGMYNCCMYVYRTETSGLQCSVESCVDVYYPSFPDNIVVSPNPSTGEFKVWINREWKSAVTLRVLDINSRVVAQFQIDDAAANEFVPVDLSNAEPGMYMVEVVADGKRWTKRVVVE